MISMTVTEDPAHLLRMVQHLARGSAVFGVLPTLCGRCRHQWPTLQEAWACHEAHTAPINEVR